MGANNQRVAVKRMHAKKLKSFDRTKANHKNTCYALSLQKVIKHKIFMQTMGKQNWL